MPGDKYPKFKAAAVQAAPVFLTGTRLSTKSPDSCLMPRHWEQTWLYYLNLLFLPFRFGTYFMLPFDQHDFYKRLFEKRSSRSKRSIKETWRYRQKQTRCSCLSALPKKKRLQHGSYVVYPTLVRLGQVN